MKAPSWLPAASTGRSTLIAGGSPAVRQLQAAGEWSRISEFLEVKAIIGYAIA
jgi:hypothetical protein